MKRVYGWAGGRAGVRYVITKFSQMDSLPNFLTHGAPLCARFARARSSAIKDHSIVSNAFSKYINKTIPGSFLISVFSNISSSNLAFCSMYLPLTNPVYKNKSISAILTLDEKTDLPKFAS